MSLVRDTQWMHKRGKSFFGNKRQIGVDVEHKLIRDYVANLANVNDSQVFDAPRYSPTNCVFPPPPATHN